MYMDEYENRRYSKLGYILLAFFLGNLGIHAFFAGKPIQGILFILFTISNSILTLVFIGYIGFFIEFIIILVQIILAASKPADKYGRII